MKNLLSLILLAAAWTASAGNVIFTDTLRRSVIYPGTTHEIKISVPDNVGSSDVPLFMGLDGILCRAPEVLDSLAAEGVIMPTVGVYLQPGIVCDTAGRVLRYNRSYEFDTPTPRFASFIATEVMPFVERLLKQNGYTLTFSADPGCRTIFGLSSGGIAAFMVAWHRPDLFGNVFTGCGTFVPMRGGNNVQAIIRKHEPKPLRIFIQDGYQDTWNPLFGSWYEANVEVASALDFAGYDIVTHWSDSGHSVKVSSILFPQVIKGFSKRALQPRPSGNGLLEQLLVPGSDWEDSATPAYAHPRLPKTILSADSTLRVSRAPEANCLLQEIRQGSAYAFAEPFYWLHNYDNSLLALGGMAFDAEGYLWVVTDAGLQICDHNGRVRAILSLPAALEYERTTIDIWKGCVFLSDGHRAYMRSFNVSPAVPGVTPKSQGPG